MKTLENGTLFAREAIIILTTSSKQEKRLLHTWNFLCRAMCVLNISIKF